MGRSSGCGETVARERAGAVMEIWINPSDCTTVTQYALKNRVTGVFLQSLNKEKAYLSSICALRLRLLS